MVIILVKISIATIDDIINVKYVVLENIKKNGWVVLNGNDANTTKILNKLTKSKIYNIILFYFP